MQAQAYRLRASDVSWQQVDDEIVVLDLAGSVYLALNGSAAVLWQHLSERPEQGATGSDLADVLVSSFEIGLDQATTDAEAFVSDAVSRGLLEPVAS